MVTYLLGNTHRHGMSALVLTQELYRVPESHFLRSFLEAPSR